MVYDGRVWGCGGRGMWGRFWTGMMAGMWAAVGVYVGGWFGQRSRVCGEVVCLRAGYTPPSGGKCLVAFGG